MGLLVVDLNTLTPALSLRERGKGGIAHNLSPLPVGEGQGEG